MGRVQAAGPAEPTGHSVWVGGRRRWTSQLTQRDPPFLCISLLKILIIYERYTETQADGRAADTVVAAPAPRSPASHERWTLNKQRKRRCTLQRTGPGGPGRVAGTLGGCRPAAPRLPSPRPRSSAGAVPRRHGLMSWGLHNRPLANSFSTH